MNMDELKKINDLMEEGLSAGVRANDVFGDGFFSKVKYAFILMPIVKEINKIKFASDIYFVREKNRIIEDFMNRMKDSSLTDKGNSTEKMAVAKAGVEGLFSVIRNTTVLVSYLNELQKEDVLELNKKTDENYLGRVSDIIDKYITKKYGENTLSNSITSSPEMKNENITEDINVGLKR